MRRYPGGLGGRLITNSDIIMDFEDTTQGSEAKHQKIGEGRSRGDDVLMRKVAKRPLEEGEGLTERDSRACAQEGRRRRVLRGAPIRADLSAISEAIPRCKTSGVKREGTACGVLYLRRWSRNFKN